MRLFFRLFSLLVWAMALQLLSTASLSQTPPPQSASSEATAAPVADSDSIVVPDGTPLRIRVVNGFSSANVKVGDVLNFVVEFHLRQEGLVIIPQRTAVTAKVLAVKQPGRAAKNGGVKIAYDPVSLPTGESVTLRPFQKPPNKGIKTAQEVAAVPGEASAVFITAGIALFALPFVKGDEFVVPAGDIEAVYLNGPLRVSRKALIAFQPKVLSGYAFLIYAGNDRLPSQHMVAPTLYCGQRVIPSRSQMEMPPGAYWFSTDYKKDHPIKVELLADHAYSISRNKHGLSLYTFPDGWVPKYDIYNQGYSHEDWTQFDTEEYRMLTAEPGTSH